MKALEHIVMGRQALSVFRKFLTLAVITPIALCLLMTMVWGMPLDAQDASGSDVSRQDIAVRDELIAAQESLLNVYRCRFSVDTEVVAGGCVDGRPLQGPVVPGVFAGTPSEQELGRRDMLVAEQESLLNVYRCQFGIDTQVVPGGCSGDIQEVSLVDGLLPPIAGLVSTSAQISDEPGREAVRYVRVDYCGPSDSPSALSMADLEQEVRYLQTHVDGFFERQSGYWEDGSNTRRSRLVLETGYLLQPNVNWASQSIAGWVQRYNSDAGSDRDFVDPCLRQAEAQDQKNRAKYPDVLILADVDATGIVGFARTGTGPALAATRNRHPRDETHYLETVAHEIGHSVYNLSHPWADLFDDTSDPDHLTLSEVEEYLSKYAEAAQSLMSYYYIQGRDTGKRPDIRASAPEHRRAYIACYQRRDAGWHVGPDCEFPDLTPETPDPPAVAPGDGQITVSWRASNDRGTEILEYHVQYQSEGSSVWTDVDWDWEFGAPLQTTVRGLTNGTEYFFRVRAENRVGKSAFFSAPASGTPQAGSPPSVTLSVGDSAQGARGADGVCSSVHCRWLHVEIENLGPGPHTLACAHNGVEQIGARRGVYKSEVVTGSTASRSCLFGYPGAEVFVIVGAERRGNSWHGGTYSNVVVWPHAEGSTTPEIRISWGSNADNRRACPPNTSCRNLSYEFIGEWDPPSYTLECWDNGLKIWEGTWSGRETTGCYYWGGPGQTAQVVINGITSNTITWPDGEGTDSQESDDEGPRVTLRQTNVDAVHEGRCTYSCTWQEVAVSGFSPGTYIVECWSHNTSDGSLLRYDRNRYKVTASPDGTGENARVCYNGNYEDVADYSARVYVTVNGIKSDTITLRRPSS